MQFASSQLAELQIARLTPVLKLVSRAVSLLQKIVNRAPQSFHRDVFSRDLHLPVEQIVSGCSFHIEEFDESLVPIVDLLPRYAFGGDHLLKRLQFFIEGDTNHDHAFIFTASPKWRQLS